MRISVGNGCDVLVFTPSQLQQLARSGEPVVSDDLRDGLALIGSSRLVAKASGRNPASQGVLGRRSAR